MKRSFAVLLAGCLTAALSAIAPPGSAAAVPVPKLVPGNVAVLVVDDFGLQRDTGEKTGGMGDDCTVGASDVGSNGAGDDLPPSGHPHGELVYDVLRDALTAALGVPPTGADEWRTAAYTVRLEAVHTAGYRTADVVDGIRQRIEALRQEKYDRFVLNLSFVAVPCDVIGWLNGADLNQLLATYDEMIRNDPTSALKTALGAYLDSSGSLDPTLVRDGTFTPTVLRDPALEPLRSFLVGAFYRTINVTRFQPKERPLATIYRDQAWQAFRDQVIQPGTAGAALKVIPVGAAGNGVKYRDEKGNLVRRGLPFPFAPALWDFVVSAGADEATDRFNAGEVTLNGTGPSVVPGSFGTSFAAPRLSALEARYLADTGNVACGGVPPLGYVDLTTTPVLNLLTNSPWRNQPKPAWPGICSPFPS